MRLRSSVFALAILTLGRVARADDPLQPGTPTLDPPTLTALGVDYPISGDDNFNAVIGVRYRVTGAADWRDAMPLQHVHAEAVQGLTVTPHFAGSIFDLAPDTSYDIELHAVDADGAVDDVTTITGRTRKVPADPINPHNVPVTDAASLTTALNAAMPGDVITLAAGTYAGSFSFQASGTADAPIVVRGADEDAVILDGMGCDACNVIEAYGSFVHIEKLTIQAANRAIRFQTSGATDNVVRRVHIKDVILGIGSKDSQASFYIADNILEGRVQWPCVYAADDATCNPSGHGTHANDDGIHVEGDGHVIAHNVVSGFGDAMKVESDGSKGVDFYGNDVLWTYDNAIELDGSQQNTRAMRNRFTNTYAPMSFQPIYGGPSYAIRNVFVNVADEQFKLHANGSTPTVGAVILHSTVVRATRAVQCSTSDAPLDFTVVNNLFVGPTALDPDGHAVRWDVPNVNTGHIDFNAFYPDGQYEYGYDKSNGGITYASFAEAKVGGTWDAHSVLLASGTLANGLSAPDDWHALLAPVNAELPAGSPAIDAASPIANVDDGFQGAAPDLGAVEFGCASPIYGVRPEGVDESNETFGCAVATGAGGATGGAGAGGSTVTGGAPASGGATSSGGAPAKAGGAAGSVSANGGNAGHGGASAMTSGGQAGAIAGGNAAAKGGSAIAAGAAGTAPNAAAPSSDSGCSCRTDGGDESGGTGMLVFAAGALVMARRRARRQVAS